MRTSTISPLVIAERKARTALVVGVCVCAASALWALWPAGSQRHESVESAADDLTLNSAGTKRSVADPTPLFAIHDAAFQAPLWSVPPAPVVKNEPPTPPPAPPLKLQLIGILTKQSAENQAQNHAATTYSAVLYDPDTDRTVTVKEGDVVATRRVERIEAQRVTFVLGNLRQSLSLDGARAEKTNSRGEPAAGAGSSSGGGQ